MHTETHGVSSVRNPRWWRDTHQSGWDRVKAALRRDWQQTKNDLTGGKQGQDLNQDVGDTLGQAFGKEPVPPETVPNPLTADEIEAKAKKAAKDMEKQAERIAKDAERSAKETERELRRGADRWHTWEEAEEPLRYGYGAASYYPDVWDDSFEPRLSREWAETYPDRSWDDVRDTVRQGWDRARMRA